MERHMTIELTDIVDADSGDTPAGADRGAKRGKAKPFLALDSEVLGDVEVQLIAMLGKGSMSVSQLLALEEGSIIGLETPLDGKIDLLLNDKLIAKGEIVAVDDHFGVRITQLVASKT
jgi:flagellar motor switch protein FliN